MQDVVKDVQRTLYATFVSFEGNLTGENELECLIDEQLTVLQETFKISTKSVEEARTMVSKKLITLFRTGKLGPFVLDTVPEAPLHVS